MNLNGFLSSFVDKLLMEIVKQHNAWLMIFTFNMFGKVATLIAINLS